MNYSIKIKNMRSVSMKYNCKVGHSTIYAAFIHQPTPSSALESELADYSGVIPD